MNYAITSDIYLLFLFLFSCFQLPTSALRYSLFLVLCSLFFVRLLSFVLSAASSLQHKKSGERPERHSPAFFLKFSKKIGSRQFTVLSGTSYDNLLCSGLLPEASIFSCETPPLALFFTYMIHFNTHPGNFAIFYFPTSLARDVASTLIKRS